MSGTPEDTLRELEELRANYEVLRDSARALATDREQMGKRRADWLATESELREEIARLQEDMERLKRGEKSEAQALQAAQMQVEMLNNQLQEARAATDELRTELASAYEDMENAENIWRGRHLECAEALTSARRQLLQTQGNVSRLREELVEAEDLYETTRDRASEQERQAFQTEKRLAQTKKELEAARNERNHLAEAMAAAERQTSRWKNLVAEHEAEIEKKRSDYLELAARASAVSEELERAQEESAVLRTAMDAAQKDELLTQPVPLEQVARERGRSLIARLTSLENLKEQADRKIEEMEKEDRRQQQRIQSLERELENTRARVERTRPLRREVNRLEKDKAALEKELSERDDELVAMKEKLRHGEARWQALRLEHDQLSEQLNKAREENQRMVGHIEMLDKLSGE